MHRFSSAGEASKAVELAKQGVEEANRHLEATAANLVRSKSIRQLRQKDMELDTAERLTEIVERKAVEKLLHAKRKAAMMKHQRRPWDGEHGAHYEVWKLERKRFLLDAGKDEDYDSDKDPDVRHERQLAAAVADPYDSDFDELETVDAPPEQHVQEELVDCASGSGQRVSDAPLPSGAD